MAGIIIKSRIRGLVKTLDSEGIINNVAEEFEDALNSKVEHMVDAAIKRAKANQRKTLLARDL